MGIEGPMYALLRDANGTEAALREVATPPHGPGTPAHATLGLIGLPGRISSLASGLLYGLVCDQQGLRLPLCASALAGSLRLGRRCVLLTPTDPAILVRKARLAGFPLQAWIRSRELAVFQVASDVAKQLFREGPERLLAELDRSVEPRGTFLVMDQADALFNLSDPAAGVDAAQRYLAWAAAREHTVLALFAASADEPRDFLVLHEVAENFGGFGLARSTEEGPVLELRHWFSAEGASARDSFELRLHGQP
jgi:hypothetical protein